MDFNFEGKRCRALEQKDALLQNTLLENSKEIIFYIAQESNWRSDCFSFFFTLWFLSFIHSLGFSIDGSVVLSPNNWATMHKDQNKYITWNAPIQNNPFIVQLR